MKPLGLNELREKYLKFFEEKEHLRLQSFSLIPQNDPSLLLINSGMAPLKPYFAGSEKPPKYRITTCQKCIRTPDIENVGKTARHFTFFEMLGNFSFGDYFKKDAIAWAWEFVIKCLEMPREKLWITIYEEDDEAFDIWNKDIGIEPERIVRMGKKDNFWEHGIGPCGPSSEIYFDRGEKFGCGDEKCAVGCECDRFVEFWNLVFTQFNRDEEGNYTLLENKNIDTGMGLERLACVMQEANTLFEVDTIKNILTYICGLAKKEYGKSNNEDVSIRVITDHIRSTTMMVCDGVIPQNEGKGYVLRRLLRRAARHGKLLGIEGNFLHDVARVVINESKTAYPELEEKESYITKVIRIEEEKFQNTIDQGLNILNQYIDEIKMEKGSVLHGEMVFKLHDTYGFPLDLTREIANENGISIDEKGFAEKMTEQKNAAREALLKNKGNDAWGSSEELKLEGIKPTLFVGYNELKSSSEIVAILRDGQHTEIAQEGDRVTVILNKTPFYAESGGQIGDRGTIRNNNVIIDIEDTRKTNDGKYLHIGTVKTGMIEKNTLVDAEVDNETRMATQRNHTVTHILHKVLKEVLGDHVNQAGSLVEPERLRFDFTHFSGVTQDELSAIEQLVNEKILNCGEVTIVEASIDEAKKMGATALFGEKYGDVVRVVKVGNFSIELCGGTHLKNSSQAGVFKIVSEGAVASGVRRIEAITGLHAFGYLRSKNNILSELCAVLKSGANDVLNKIDNILDESKKKDKEIESLKAKLVSGDVDSLINDAIEIRGVKVVRGRLDQLDMDQLRTASDTIKNKVGSGIVVLASAYGDKANFIVTATKDILSKGIHSGNIVRDVAKVAGGGGGGRPDMAQAGGKDLTKIDLALDKAAQFIEASLRV